MAVFTWYNGEVPENLKVTQVYGVIFTQEGKLLMKVEDTSEGEECSLAGGTTEKFDVDMEATLRRELIEEVNVTIEKPKLIGYQVVDEENGTPLYAQVRMVALIKNIGPTKPDPDNGKTYGRILVSPKKAIELLGWGDVGRKLITEGTRIAEEELGIKVDNSEEINAINY